MEKVRIELHPFHDFKVNVVKKDDFKFYITNIEFRGGLIVKEEDCVYFIELLNGFVQKILDPDKVYSLKYNDTGTSFELKVVQKNGKKYLRLSTFYGNEQVDTVFLEKVDCKVIAINFNKIYSKCTRSEFL